MRESHAKRASQKIHGQQVMGGSSGRATGDGARGHNRTAGPGDALAGGGGGASISPGVAPAQGKGGDPPRVQPALTGWTLWERQLALPHLSRGRLAPAPPEASPQKALGSLRLALSADQVYDSVEVLAHALQAQLPTFTPWQRHDPSFKRIVSWVVWTSAGPRQVTIMLDTGATASSVLSLPAYSTSPSRRRQAPWPSAWRRPTPLACCRRRWSFTWPSARPNRFAK